MKCKRCGTCCEKGGPILHHQDLQFLQKNLLSLSNLMVIRQGELAYDPVFDDVVPTEVEMIKIVGAGKSWECPFHKKVAGQSECSIHRDRPLECSLLKCWDTSEITAMIGKDCLSRFDLLGQANPMLPEIKEHEYRCNYGLLWSAVNQVRSGDEGAVANLENIMVADLTIRQSLIAEFDLSLAQELFYLGTPMFRGVKEPGISIELVNDLLSVKLVEV